MVSTYFAAYFKLFYADLLATPDNMIELGTANALFNSRANTS